MPVQVASFIIPKNGAQWYLVEDRFVKGGFQTVPTSNDRDAIPSDNRKEGMLVWVQSDHSLWQLTYDLTTWKNLQLGGVEGPSGPTGPKGDEGNDAYEVWIAAGNQGSVQDFFASQKGEKGDVGPQGAKGDTGATGKSTYQEWLDAGNAGTEKEFLKSLVGKSTYEEWLDLGFTGSVEDFLIAMKGDKGDAGESLKINAVGKLADRSQYENQEIGFTFLDEENSQLYVLKSATDPKWSDPISYAIGIQGPQGEIGPEGKSSYDLWRALGNTGTLEDYFAAQKGEKGDKGDAGEKGDKGDMGETGPAGPQGNEGAVGKSNYEIWLETHIGTEEDYFAFLRGQPGDTGPQGEVGPIGETGKSAYQEWLDSGKTGTVADMLAENKGEKGDKGDKGDTGSQGPKGDTGLKGDKGDTGPQGPEGKSPYQLWRAAGHEGTEEDYFAYIRGSQGNDGPVGPQGPKGDQGIQGPKGDTGTVSNTLNDNFTVNGTLKYKNIFANLAAFPDANTYEGMFGVAEDTNKAYFSSDGAWVELAIQVERVIPYDLSFFIPGTMPNANELVGSVLVTRTIAISMIGSGSLAKAFAAPTAQTVYAIKVNAQQVGTVTFAAGQTTGTIAFTQNQTLVAGDVVQIVTPGTVDASIKDVMITFVGRAQAPQLSMSFT